MRRVVVAAASREFAGTDFGKQEHEFHAVLEDREFGFERIRDKGQLRSGFENYLSS